MPRGETRGFRLRLFALVGHHSLPPLLSTDGGRESISDFWVAGDLGRRSAGGHHAIQVPVIVHRVTVPTPHTASSGDSAIGDMLVGAVTKSLQHLPGGDRSDAECTSYISESCRPAGLGVLPRSVSSHRLFAARPSVDLSDGQHSVAVVQLVPLIRVFGAPCLGQVCGELDDKEVI